MSRYQVIHSLAARIGSALFYMITSVLIMIINKQCLTVFRFPSFQFLGLGQMISTIVILRISKLAGVVDFPDLSWSTLKQVHPLPLFYLGNMVFGLGGTQNLSLPMFTALRRLELWLTMIGEAYVLSIWPSMGVKLSISFIIFGSIIAVMDDLTFNFLGYACVTLNNISTACVVVFVKRAIDTTKLGIRRSCLHISITQ